MAQQNERECSATRAGGSSNPTAYARVAMRRAVVVWSAAPTGRRGGEAMAYGQVVRSARKIQAKEGMSHHGWSFAKQQTMFVA